MFAKKSRRVNNRTSGLRRTLGQQLADLLGQGVGSERFLQELRLTGASFVLRIARDEECAQRWVTAFELGKKLTSIHDGHHDVGDEEVDFVAELTCQLECLVGALGGTTW